MKTSGSTIGARFCPPVAPLTKYFVKYVQGMKIRRPYSGLRRKRAAQYSQQLSGHGMSANEQARFVRENLGPAFATPRSIQILVFDHNWDQIEFPVTVLDDTKAAAYSAGMRFIVRRHGNAQSELYNRFPKKCIWLTECSAGVAERQTASGSDGFDHRRNAELGPKAWCCEPGLDQEHSLSGWMQNLRGVVTIDHSSSPTKVIPNVDFTAWPMPASSSLLVLFASNQTLLTRQLESVASEIQTAPSSYCP